jgi:prevent-host-death family protein
MATTLSIRELKSSLREILRRVKAGESILVTERGTPIARIIPVEPELVSSATLRFPLRPRDTAAALPRAEEAVDLVLAEPVETVGRAEAGEFRYSLSCS